jgi:hypothetical protein
LIDYCFDHHDNRLCLSVLNPTIRFTWIKSQWGAKYIRRAKESILERVSAIYHSAHISMTSLVQMRVYRSQMSSGAATTANAPVQPPIARAKSSSVRPTWFKIEHPALHEMSPLPQESGVETEFRKYASGEVSSKETDMLAFWEVRPFS